MPIYSLGEILHPRSIAVAGAGMGSGGNFIMALLDIGFKGKIYPMNPRYQEIQGLKCYPSITSIPEPVDYVISSLPAGQVLELIDDCAKNGVKCIHFYTARFSETGRKDAIELEKQVLQKAKAAGIRIIGPNCMGVYYPAAGLAFGTGQYKQPGKLGLISQSGAAVSDFSESARRRNMFFSKAISYGNAIDLNECDYLEYLARDPETDIIIMYVEGVRDGQRFFNVLRQATLKKPVIILKGGRGKSGTRATASHTASLAGSMEIWNSALKQAGVISASDVNELIDIASAFYFLPVCYGKHVGITGGAGGGSVMAADLAEEAGLEVIPLPDDIRQELKRAGSSVWDWISNPIDHSISSDYSGDGSLERLMIAHPDFDLFIMQMNTPRAFGWGKNPAPITVDSMLHLVPLDALNGKPVMVAMTDRWGLAPDSLVIKNKDLLEKLEQRLYEKGIPAYPSITRAANAYVKMVGYYKRRRDIIS